jgi:hypothetical protein
MVCLFTHSKETSALVPIPITHHGLLFHVYTPAVVAGTGSHDIVRKGEAAYYP